MPTTLELCEKYFGTRDVYYLLKISKDADKSDSKSSVRVFFFRFLVILKSNYIPNDRF